MLAVNRALSVALTGENVFDWGSYISAAVVICPVESRPPEIITLPLASNVAC
jgi:hypothetical protein